MLGKVVDHVFKQTKLQVMNLNWGIYIKIDAYLLKEGPPTINTINRNHSKIGCM